MDLTNKRIGLALSGGGIRAAIFHLGVLDYLARAGLFKQISYLSTVSGASMAIGLLLAENNNRWPSEETFLTKTLPAIKNTILRENIQRSALLRLPFSPMHWRHRVNLLAKMLEDKWGIKGNLQDIPTFPFWEINCTTFETGNNFRIRRDYMGDSKVGYVRNPNIPISHVVAASAAFPVLIGPYVLKTNPFAWTKNKIGAEIPVTPAAKYTLWDGGVYDNLGLDPLHKTGRGLDKEVDFLLVSNASAPMNYKRRQGRVSISNLRRLLEISQNQVDVLRTREVLSSIIMKGLGLYYKIGYTAGQFATLLGIPEDKIRHLTKKSLTEKETDFVSRYPTTLNSPKEKDFNLIFRHGHENAESVFFMANLLSPQGTKKLSKEILSNGRNSS